MLALKLMIYFSEQNPKEFVQIILENSCQFNGFACPFVASSIEIVKVICEMFLIMQEDSTLRQDQCSVFAPMVFDSIEFLEVCICY